MLLVVCSLFVNTIKVFPFCYIVTVTALICPSFTRTAEWWICTKSFQVMKVMLLVLFRVFEEWVVNLTQLY